MRAWLICLALVAASAVGAFWFWRLGDVPMAKSETLSVHRSTGQVETVKEGDVIRTGDETATLSFFGLGETRLAPQTVLVLNKAYRPYAFGSGIVVDMDLQQGRAWSRVQKLFDPVAAFRVRAGQMTASVRGTSFDIRTSATGTAVAVADASVEIEGAAVDKQSGVPDAPIVVGEGSVMTFGPKGNVLATKPVTEELRQSDWYAANALLDQHFDADAHRRVSLFTEALGARPLDGFAGAIVTLSERVHMRLTPSDAPRIAALQALRRVAAMKRLADDGKTGLAFEAWDALRRDMSAYLSLSEGDAYASALRHALQDGMFLLSDALPGSQAYPLKLDVEEAFIDMGKNDPVSYQHARLVGIDARLDEADKLISSSSLDVAQSGLDAAREGIANVERELDHLPPGVPEGSVRIVRSKLFVVKSREASLRIRLATALQPPVGTMTSDAATSTTP